MRVYAALVAIGLLLMATNSPSLKLLGMVYGGLCLCMFCFATVFRLR